jgi:CheY-like chemotaxis protein
LENSLNDSWRTFILTDPVLIVDDEPQLRSLLGKVLCRQGFQTVEAGDGDSALGMAKGLDGKLLVLVTDIDMPGTMNGVELAKLVRSAFPAIPVVFISALPFSCIVLEEAAPGCMFVQKPFDSKTLISAIQTLTCSDSPS